MRPIQAFAALAALLPTAALAHEGPEGHLHPHGIEGLLIAAALIGGIWLFRRARR